MLSTERLTSEYNGDLSNRFKVNEISYTNQYYIRSISKLELIRPFVIQTAKVNWTDVNFELDAEHSDQNVYYLVKQIKDSKNRCVIIGTLFKDMKCRPSVLDEYSNCFEIRVEEKTEYTSEDDLLIIEDCSLRLTLTGKIDPHVMVSGVVIGVKGYCTNKGSFFVEDYVLPGPPFMLFKPIISQEKYLAIISGLELGTQDVNSNGLILLRDFILGNIFSELSKRVVRLVVMGNGIGNCTVETLPSCDLFYTQLAASINVDLVPGERDPTNLNLPQQVIHPYLLDFTSRYETFRSTTNPYFFTLDGVRFLGVGGQTVQDICNYSHLSELDALKLIANSRCIAPTGTDSLGCHPELDVFNLVNDSEYPHVFVSGDCKEYASGSVDCFKMSQLPKLVCVPAFKSQPSVTLISLKTLETQLIKLI